MSKDSEGELVEKHKSRSFVATSATKFNADDNAGVDMFTCYIVGESIDCVRL